jgi:H+-translocating NAD(P) transhydrogenase subunit alpha
MFDVVLMLFVFVVSFLVGYVLILRIPARLHTPLMSMTNAVSGVTILGAMLLFAKDIGAVEKTFGLAAVALAAFNLVGGFAVTDRMLRLFRRKAAP